MFKMTAKETDAMQGKQMMSKLSEPTEIERIADTQSSPESPIAQVMATILNPNAANLAALADMFKNYVSVMPLPDYVKESALAFVSSLERWSDEQSKAKVIEQTPVPVEVTNAKS